MILTNSEKILTSQQRKPIYSSEVEFAQSTTLNTQARTTSFNIRFEIKLLQLKLFANSRTNSWQKLWRWFNWHENLATLFTEYFKAQIASNATISTKPFQNIVRNHNPWVKQEEKTRQVQYIWSNFESLQQNVETRYWLSG